MSKIKIEDIRKELDSYGWQLISNTYKNLDEELVFKCSEGHNVYNSWKKIRTKPLCPICQHNKLKNINTQTIPKKSTKRFLALDQATYLTGWSIYDGKELIKYGTFETNLENEIARDHKIKEWLINMINIWQCDMIGIEGIQYQQNMGVTTFEKLARLQGILLDTVYELNIPYKICPTNTWRAHCEVKGRTRSDKKKSMQILVKKWFDITVTDDEADAIGIGKYISDTGIKEIIIENWE